MNDTPASHASDDLLQALIDGELPEDRQPAFRAHLDSCWTCRTRFEESVSAIGEFVRLREHVFQERGIGLPDWPDLRPLLQKPAPRRSPVRSVLKFRRLALALGCLGAAALAVTLIVTPRVSAPPKPHVLPPVVTSREPISEPAPPVIPPEKAGPRLSDASIEFRVLAALHSIGADLGEPVDWTRIGAGRFRVDLRGLDSRREAEIRSALEGIPGVSVHKPRAVPLPPTVEFHPEEVPLRPPAFEEELRSYTGGRRQLENFTNAVLDCSDSILVRAHALRRARQLPAADLVANERLAFERIQQQYLRGMRENAAQLRALLAPLFDRLDIPPEDSPGDGLVQAAERVDTLVNSMLAGSSSNLDDRRLVAQLRGDFERLSELLGP